jgi:hypothetical protein
MATKNPDAINLSAGDEIEGTFLGKPFAGKVEIIESNASGYSVDLSSVFILVRPSDSNFVGDGVTRDLITFYGHQKNGQAWINAWTYDVYVTKAA